MIKENNVKLNTLKITILILYKSQMVEINWSNCTLPFNSNAIVHVLYMYFKISTIIIN